MRERKASASSGIMSVACVIIGLIIGAGFASGQELIQFFIKHGAYAYAGILISGALIFLTTWATLDICMTHNIKGYGEFMKYIFGEKLGRLLDIAVFLFMGVLFCTMLAGAGALAEQSLGISFTTGTIMLAIFCFITFLFDIKGIIQINTVLVPIMAAGFTLIGLCAILTEGAEVFLYGSNPASAVLKSFVFSAFVYSSYNLITAVPVLAGMGGVLGSKKSARAASAISAVVLTLISLLFAVSMLADFDIISAVEIPLIKLARGFSAEFEYIYIFIMFCAIFTTAIADGFAVVERVSVKMKQPRVKLRGVRPFHVMENRRVLSKALVCVFGVIIAHAGFSTLVAKVYPVFGVIGIFEVTAILYKFFRRSR